jgi:hypothetical protein
MSRPGAQSVPRPAGGPQRAGQAEPWRGTGRGGPSSSPASTSSSYGGKPTAPRSRTPGGRAGPASPRRPRSGDGPAGGAAAGLRLTGRGAILCLFVLSFLGILLSGWLGTGVLADVFFLLGCCGIAWYTKPSDLLSVAVSPPLAFFFACVLAKLASSSGGTSAAEGTLVTLATSAPWLFAGTALTIVIALRRGLLDNIRELRQGLQGTPGGKVARADGRARRR